MRLRSLLLTAALSAAALSVVPSPAAHAAPTTTTRLFYLADTAAHPGVYGLVSRDLDGSAVKTLVPGVAGVDLWAAQVSPDGTRVAYLRIDKNATQLWLVDSGGGWNHRVFVFGNRDKFQLRWQGNGALLYTDLNRQDTRIYRLALDLMPRNPVAWAQAPQGDNTVDVANPAPDNLGGIIGNYPGDKVVRISGPSAPVAVTGSPLDTTKPVASADGSTIVFTHLAANSTDATPLGDLWTLKGGARKTIATGSYNGRPFVGPGDVVYWDKAADQAHGFRGDLYSVPIDGSAQPTRLTSTPDVDEYSVSAAVVPTSYQSSVTASAPSVQLAGAHPRIGNQSSDTNTAQADRVDGILCRSAGTTPLTTPCAAPLAYGPATVTDAVALGSTNTYTQFLTDVYGNLAPTTASKTMQAIGTAVSAAVPTSSSTATAPFRVTWGQGAAAGATWSVSWAVNKPPSYTTSSFQHWTTTGLTSAVFGAGSVPTVPTLGDTFSFHAVGTDAYGNSTSTFSVRTVVPADQNVATYTSGWTTEARAGRWLGSVKGTTRAGAAALVALRGNVYYLIGERCTTCGQLKVYVDGVLKATVDTHASSYRQRQVLWSGSFSSVAKRNLRVQAVGTAGHPRVNVDGFAARR